MNKDQIIKNLSEKNEALQEQVRIWKRKYKVMEEAYNQLLNHQNRIISDIHTHEKEQQSIKLEDFTFPIKKNKQEEFSISNYEQKNQQKLSNKQTKSNSLINIQRQEVENQFQFFSENLQKQSGVGNQLIEGCFIIEKNGSINHFDPVKFLYPAQALIKNSDMFDVIYRYIFTNQQIPEIYDDDLNSRRNQILHGSSSEDFFYIFDNVQGKGKQKIKLTNFEIKCNLLRKRYIFGIVRPQITIISKQMYETEIAYGFITTVPFPTFFKDLNRIVQQEVKYMMLNSKVQVNKQTRIKMVSKIIEDITKKSLELQLSIRDFPINLELNANICGLRLAYSTEIYFKKDQLNQIEQYVRKFSLLKLSKIFHYILAEKHIVVVCKSRKSLNQLFQIIRAIIYPFNWVFPIIYYYTNYFQPFLSSPLPILIGFIDHHEEVFDQEQEDKRIEQKHQKSDAIPQNDFVTIYAEDQKKEDINEIMEFNVQINKLYKQLIKSDKHKQPEMKSNISNLKGQKIHFCSIFETFVNNLKKFIETGNLPQNINQFYIDFMETQMAAYYKQNLEIKKDIKA